MLKKDELKAKLTKGLNLKTDTALSKSLSALEDVREVVESSFQTIVSNAVVNLEPGFPTNYGQQYRLVLTNTQGKFEQGVCRIYVPIEGTPIRIDIDGETLSEFKNMSKAADYLVTSLSDPLVSGFLVGMLKQFAA